jgi:hypothetical protein
LTTQTYVLFRKAGFEHSVRGPVVFPPGVAIPADDNETKEFLDGLPKWQRINLTAFNDLPDVPDQLLELAQLVGTAAAGYVFKDTLSALNADLDHEEGVRARVDKDITPSNNGDYVKVGASGAGSWDYLELQPASVADLAGKVDATRSITGTGLASGGGTLDDDRVIDVAEASEAEAQAGAAANVVMTPRRVTDLVNKRRGEANGLASLDGDGTIPVSELPSAVLGTIQYQGVWDANTNSPAIPAASTGNKGHYYRVSTAGATEIDGESSWSVGDWIVSNGVTWDKIDNSETVASVAGRTGAVTLDKSDVGLQNVDNTPDADKPVSVPQQSALDNRVGPIEDRASKEPVPTLAPPLRFNGRQYDRIFGDLIGNPLFVRMLESDRFLDQVSMRFNEAAAPVRTVNGRPAFVFTGDSIGNPLFWAWLDGEGGFGFAEPVDAPNIRLSGYKIIISGSGIIDIYGGYLAAGIVNHYKFERITSPSVNADIVQWTEHHIVQVNGDGTYTTLATVHDEGLQEIAVSIPYAGDFSGGANPHGNHVIDSDLGGLVLSVDNRSIDLTVSGVHYGNEIRLVQGAKLYMYDGAAPDPYDNPPLLADTWLEWRIGREFDFLPRLIWRKNQAIARAYMGMEKVKKALISKWFVSPDDAGGVPTAGPPIVDLSMANGIATGYGAEFGIRFEVLRGLRSVATPVVVDKDAVHWKIYNQVRGVNSANPQNVEIGQVEDLHIRYSAFITTQASEIL